jgi:hypothetical protein
VAILGFGKLSMTFVPDLVRSAGLDREYLLRYPAVARARPTGQYGDR